MLRLPLAVMQAGLKAEPGRRWKGFRGQKASVRRRQPGRKRQRAGKP